MKKPGHFDLPRHVRCTPHCMQRGGESCDHPVTSIFDVVQMASIGSQICAIASCLRQQPSRRLVDSDCREVQQRAVVVHHLLAPK